MSRKKGTLSLGEVSHDGSGCMSAAVSEAAVLRWAVGAIAAQWIVFVRAGGRTQRRCHVEKDEA